MTVEIVLPSRDNLYFDEIPHLFANAIHPLSQSDKNDFPYHAALLNYEEELKKAVIEGLLTPHNPLDLLPIRQPIGEQLKRSIITFDNLAEYANSLGFLLSIKNTVTNEEKANQTENTKPWLIKEPDDPDALQSWYTPARYFARQLVIKDSTLLNKRPLLAHKTAQALKNAGIYKRGGKLALADTTILKAFSNVAFN
jgi:hypothetical protein